MNNYSIINFLKICELKEKHEIANFEVHRGKKYCFDLKMIINDNNIILFYLRFIQQAVSNISFLPNSLNTNFLSFKNIINIPTVSLKNRKLYYSASYLLQV